MMRQAPYTLLYIIVTVVFTAAIVSACDENIVYDSYAHTPFYGWEKNDTLRYHVSPLHDSGSFSEVVGIRINRNYPFTSLSLVVEQHILPGFRHHVDTLRCEFIPNDHLRGQAVSYSQYDFPLRTLDLRRGDSLEVTIRHAMKREILLGISDIGFKMTKGTR
jgi:gliding motility-associated lipoprotein GldH